ncbi:hypothetical protein [Ensifer aridi]|uniref:hypothetical protein n=1 Tax=Ensifer aridi TaxID=1708715 RepID=UPI001FCD4122|nr:hypothetical protein [Ensifer aridi]
MPAGNLGDARAARLNLLQNPKLVLVPPDTAALDARQNLNPPHKFTLGYVDNYGISDVTSDYPAKSQRLLHRTLTVVRLPVIASAPKLIP